MEWSKKRQVLILIFIEIILMVLMGLFTNYGPQAAPKVPLKDKLESTKLDNLGFNESSIYPSKLLLLLHCYIPMNDINDCKC